MNKNTTGFTIVELLIVIVVIAVLAVISIVTYDSISNRAHDTAVKNDLAQMARKLQVIHAETGAYPAGGGNRASASAAYGGSGTAFSGFSFRPSKGSYAPTGTDTAANLVYCTAIDAASGLPAFVIWARSKSNTLFVYSSLVGLTERPAGTSVMPEDYACASLGGWPRSWSYGLYGANGGTWQTWTN